VFVGGTVWEGVKVTPDQLGLLTAIAGLVPNPAPVIVTEVLVPAFREAGMPPVMLTGCTSVMLTGDVLQMAGLAPLIQPLIVSPAVPLEPKVTVDARGAV
jgi:hypothetical protein